MDDDSVPIDDLDSVVSIGSIDASGDAGDGETADELTGDQTAKPRHPRRRLWWVIGISSVVTLAIVIGMFTIRMPYYVISPGSVRPAEKQIEIRGAKNFDSEGKVQFVTVYINRATPALLIRSKLDESVDVRSEKEMYPDGDEEESRRENVILMDTSKIVAEKVALSYVGIDASFVGEGALVAGLVAASPSKGVLRPGDVLIEVDDDRISMPDDIGVALADRRPGDVVNLVVERGAGTAEGQSASVSAKPSRKTVEVALGADPEESNRPVLGIYVEPFDLSVDSPVDITVDSGDVTGPSAGLAWTLAIVDRLTPGPLTKGRKVAVTGEIRADGTVGPIGGILQKVAAVKRSGADLFIYPASTPKKEQAEMKRVAGDGLALHAVKDIDEAVKVLAPEGVRKP